ncbi:Clp protease N-terminal domain-containing protein [Phenylobacterium sp.]|uniref:Clp protease N-terminal domain-containing protein n=1 Tax=Phenylobacterium sp. TaxID=1871053 RepID=UPI00286D7153|nr:Clp protease N-terminal domain-containing protein [Phenylobacterium sp.]
MFAALQRRLKDMGTLKSLCLQAEAHALADHQRQPGAEHFLLAALDLPDGAAGRAFARLHADPAGLRRAITQQYGEALASVGLDPAHADSVEPPAKPTRLYDAAASGQAVLKALAARKQRTPLLSGDVVAVIAEMQQGVAPRSLRAMGVDPAALKSAALAEVSAYQAGR